MNQVIVGVFASYRDGHEALRALQLAGLKRDDAHLYRAGHADTAVDDTFATNETLREDDAEYAGHGEHQGVTGARNRFSTASVKLPEALTRDDAQMPDCRERTLLVIKLSDDIKAAAIGEVLHEHGAVAVKDGSGHWRFSPYRSTARTPR
jgi:hypothetical protein